jgi:N-acetylneuraminate synthase
MRTFIIAEAGVNHNGSMDLATRLIDVAAQAGADAIKFQTFRAEKVVTQSAAKAQYQMRATDAGESQVDMLRRLQLSDDDHEVLIRHAADRGIAFLSTPFDLDSLVMLTDRLGLQTIKVPSGEITNAPFLLAVARRAQRVIVSTGMCTLAEVEAALGVLAFGFTATASAVPNGDAFDRAFAADAGQTALRERVVLLHCTTEYPAPVVEVNLRAMAAMANAFGLRVGYSDHTAGIHLAVAAVALGAVAIEKHFTLDRKLPGPDHEASIEPQELSALVRQVRDLEQALGGGIKHASASEWKNRSVVRRSLVAAKPIKAGEAFTVENLSAKRPGAGLTPFAYWRLLGQRAQRAYVADEPIEG